MAGGISNKSRDERWMHAALALSERGRGRTGANPNVGCIIVKDDIVVGRGWTQPGGRPHAEAMALAEAGEAARGASVYVTLEPCAHESERGRPCASLLTEAGVARVIGALTDPDQRTCGKGFAALEAADISVERDCLSDQAIQPMAGFLTQMKHGRPHVTLKLALSLDGQIALSNGSSQWITGNRARAHAHLERARADAILTGGGTFRADAPRLNVRIAGLEERSPERFLLSRNANISDGWQRIAAPEDIAGLTVNWLLVEGGAQVAASFLGPDLVDRLLIYRAPIILGSGLSAIGNIGLSELSQAHGRWRMSDERALGPDQMITYDRIR